MNLYDSVLASQPSNVFELNAAGTAFIDALNRGTALTGTQSLTNSLVTGNSKSLLARNSNVLNFATSVYNAKRADSPFSLEAWVRPQYFTTSTMSILSHNGEYDGLWLDADNINFTVKFGTDTATVSWPIPDSPSTYHVVGIYDSSKITLMIDSAVVAQKEVADFIQQNFKAFASPNLYIGQSASANQVATVDGIAVYTRGLSDAEVYRHFVAGRRVLSVAEIANIYGGTTFDSTSRDSMPSKQWDTALDWSLGSYSDVEFVSDDLKPILDTLTGLSLPGVWTSQYEASISAVVYGIVLDWDSDGSFTVQASKDLGTTWISVTNGITIPGTFAWTTAGSDLLIRITFTGGVTGDISSIRTLRARGYSSPTVYGSFSTRNLTVNAAVTTSSKSSQPVEGKADSGFRTTLNGGVININPDTDADDPYPVGTLEVWHKFSGLATSKFVFDARPAGGTPYLWVNGSNQLAFVGMSAVYVNGAPVTSGTLVILPDVWYHIVAVFTTAIATRIDIQTGDRDISVLNVYPTALTAPNAALMYSMYSDYPNAVLATEANPITEGANAYALYGYDWSIAPAG